MEKASRLSEGGDHEDVGPVSAQRKADHGSNGWRASPALGASHRPRPDGSEIRLRHRRVRCLHGAGRPQGRPRLPDAGQARRGQRGPDDRRPRARRKAPPAPAGLPRARRLPVRLLHARDDPERLRAPRPGAEALARRDREGDGEQPLPLRGAPANRRGDRRRRPAPGKARHERPGSDRPAAVLPVDRRRHRRLRQPRPFGALLTGESGRLSRGLQRVPAHRQGRARDRLFGKNRDGSGRDDLPGADGGRGARRRPRVDRHGPRRHGPLPVRPRNVRLADHPHVRPGPARGRGRGPARPAAGWPRRGSARRREGLPSRTESSRSSGSRRAA